MFQSFFIKNCLVAIFLLTGSFVSFSQNSISQIKVGDHAPEIKLPDSLGKWTNLSDIKSELILIDFWASWCKPCDITSFELKKIKNEYPNASFEIYALSLDRDYWNWVKKVRKYDLPFIHVNDAYGLKSPRCKAYGVDKIPRKFLVRNNKIVAINPSFDEIRKAIQETLITK